MAVKGVWRRPRLPGRRAWSAILAGSVILLNGFIGSIEFSNALDSSEKPGNEPINLQGVWGKGRAYIQSQRGATYTLADEMASFKGLAEDAPVVAGDSLATGPQSFTLIGDDGSELSEVMPGTPLTVVRNSGSRVEVEIRGWSIKAYPVALMTAVGQRILQAKLSKAGVEAQQLISRPRRSIPTPITWATGRAP